MGGFSGKPEHSSTSNTDNSAEAADDEEEEEEEEPLLETRNARRLMSTSSPSIGTRK